MGRPATGFTYVVVGSEVRISRAGRVVTVLRGDAAQRFLTEIERGNSQLLMARVTGNYKRGNERSAKRHTRNQPG